MVTVAKLVPLNMNVTIYRHLYYSPVILGFSKKHTNKTNKQKEQSFYIPNSNGMVWSIKLGSDRLEALFSLFQSYFLKKMSTKIHMQLTLPKHHFNSNSMLVLPSGHLQ